MTVLDTAIDARTPGYLEGRNTTLDRLERLEAAIEEARAGGGERAVTRHHARGKLLPRERVEMLLDQDAPFLELSPVCGWGTEFAVGAGVVTGIGVVEAAECMIIATDPTVEGTSVNPYAVEKIRRAVRIAAANRLPLVNLVESAAETTTNGSPPGGGVARDLSRLAGARVPTVGVVFGPTSGDAAYLPALSDYTILVRGHAKSLPRADQLAEDERDALRLARQCVRRLNWRKCGPQPRSFPPAEPKYDAEDLLALAGAGRPALVEPREVLARILDASDFDEFKPAVGAAVLAGWGELHGYPVGVLSTSGGPQSAADTQKAVHFIQLANATDTSLLLIRPGDTGALGSGAVDALAHSTVPLLALNTGRTGDPRFAFRWPADGPLANGDDDGVIDPRDTRTVLGLCLSAVHSAAVEGAGHVGVFRSGKVDQ
ncbi:acetyl-CoA carboxylase carboxyltransferase subunit [Actinoplanes sp. Pm04-4]|uniref:Acetyl-CoA carboxylase carboxyltransferase subunit n=1 Tax=Paractinoplanes pyxinae TaxID=2997416 RepID=A0ABT4B7R0_9ACTN|nr:carboxyl transferase domain-containing protein [Actinoplanes pyxinae]MCY1142547.1 acetyl-CoA carboxylase carboxyltransferase subunit [Actinoplanes pyxinae]